MEKNKMEYGLIEPDITKPRTNLLAVPHKGEPLIVMPLSCNYIKSREKAFDGLLHLKRLDKGTYNQNAEILKSNFYEFYNSEKFPSVRFRVPLTQESISAAACEFGPNAYRNLQHKWLQLGKVVRTKDGVFTNTSERDEAKLKTMLDGAKKVNGIYLIDEKMAFAPYESFKTGRQERREFAEGGLARALEHTDGTVAGNLARMLVGDVMGMRFSAKVNVFEPESIEKPSSRKPISRVAALYCNDFFRPENFKDGNLTFSVNYACGANVESGQMYGVMKEE